MKIQQKTKIPSCKQFLKTRGISSSYEIWLQQKRQFDKNLYGNSQKIWIIKDKLYDLTNFIDKHPGGYHWIEYTKGQNITEHYLTHHLNQQKTDQILQKYQIKLNQYDQNQIKKLLKKNQRYTFQQNGLFRQVKKRLLNKYTAEQLQNSTQTKIIGSIIFIFWILSLILTGIYSSYLLALLCGYLILGVTGIAHNFVHKKPSIFKYFYLVTGFTPKQWQIMHCLSHHEYTNTLLDYQIQAFQPLCYFLRSMPQNNLLKIVIVKILFLLVIPSNIVLKLIVVPLVKRCEPEWQYLVPLSEILLLYLLNENIWLSIKLFLVIHCFFGIVFINVTFGSHRMQQLWTQGEQQIKDYGEHCLYTSHDNFPKLKGGFLSFLIMSGFNIHIAHHLFPTIDNQHLYKANEIIDEICKQKGLKKCPVPNLFRSILSVQKNYLNRKKFDKNYDSFKGKIQ